MQIGLIDTLEAIAPEEWNRCSDNPFLQHAFLTGLEQFDCLAAHGWYPQHLVAKDSGGQLLGAMPLYAKTNSYGEFVFDWNWAEAYERNGLPYYPKLVNAIPYTPSIGPRLLVMQTLALDEQRQIRTHLLQAAQKLMAEREYSSLHCLFPTPEEAPAFAEQGLILRSGCQFHWHNRGYCDFDDFLDTLTAKRRKEIKRERRSISANGVEIEVLNGHDTTAEHWRHFFGFYRSTFARKWGEPRLTLKFFQHIARTLPALTVLLLARQEGHYVAGAFAMRGVDTLHGRHWGCSTAVPNLHFELCYYRTIDYCIAHGLQRLDAGAQGDEHKFPRGFEPVLTTSAHRLADPRFAKPIRAYVSAERKHIEAYLGMLRTHTPYRTVEPVN
jgi:uncharacterized protein